MQSLQLDEQMCLSFMWDSNSPREQSCNISPPIWPGHCEIWGCFFFFCGFFWAFLCRCGKGGSGQADPKTDDKAVKTPKANKLEALLATLDPEDPLREDLQPQLDQLRNDLRDPRQPGARLDSAVAKQHKAEAKVAKCEEALRQAEESDPSTELACTSLNHRFPNSGLTRASTSWTRAYRWHANFPEKNKRNAGLSGQRRGCDLNRLDRGMIPVVLEQYGRTALKRLIQHRTQVLVIQGLAAYLHAKQQASAEMWAPLPASCSEQDGNLLPNICPHM